MPDVVTSCYLARQPILGRQRTVVGYDLQFRPPGNTGELVHDVRATAAVMVHAFADLGVTDVLGDRFGVVHVGPDLFWSDTVDLLPAAQVMLELTAEIEPDERVRDRCEQLRGQGFGLAVTVRGRSIDTLPPVDLVRVDALEPDLADTVHVARRAVGRPIRVLADHVSSRAQAEEALAAGIDLLQGWFFAEPVTVDARTVDSSRVTAVQLLSELLGEAETVVLENTIKRDPSLTHRLLRIVNASAHGLRTPVSSVRQAISLVGRAQLLRWAQLLVYAGGGRDPLADPLLLTAATRGRLLEELVLVRQGRCGRPVDPEQPGRAFLVGVLSLLDVVLGMPMERVVAHLPLDPRIVGALLLRRGELGQLLRLVELHERDDVRGVNLVAASLDDLPLHELTIGQLRASRWADELTRAMAA